MSRSNSEWSLTLDQKSNCINGESRLFRHCQVRQKLPSLAASTVLTLLMSLLMGSFGLWPTEHCLLGHVLEAQLLSQALVSAEPSVPGSNPSLLKFGAGFKKGKDPIEKTWAWLTQCLMPPLTSTDIERLFLLLKKTTRNFFQAPIFRGEGRPQKRPSWPDRKCVSEKRPLFFFRRWYFLWKIHFFKSKTK